MLCSRLPTTRPQLAVEADPSTGRSRFTAGLGLATVTPLALAPLLAPSRGTSQVFGVLVVVAYAGHIAVTGWLWTVPDVRQNTLRRPMRLVAVPVALVVVAAALALALPGRLLEWVLLGFFAWQFSHFQRQNLGLVTMIGTKWAAEPLRKLERRLVVVGGWCGTGALIARPSLLGLPNVIVPRLLAGSMVTLAAVAYTTLAIAAVVGTLHVGRPLPVRAAYLTSVLFVAPVFLFQSAQGAVAGMVVAHGLQYLWGVRCRSCQAQTVEARAGWKTTFAVVLLAVLGGSLLEAMSELHSAQSSILRLLYGAYLGIVMAHFAVDGVLWRRPRPPGRLITAPRGAATLTRTRETLK